MIFIDANFWIAFFYSHDSCHDRARELYRELKERYTELLLVVNNFIVGETLTVLSQKGGKQQALTFYELLVKSKTVRLVYIDAFLQTQAMNYFRRAQSKNVSFADCTIFATVDMLHITHIISFDKQLQYQKGVILIDDPSKLP